MEACLTSSQIARTTLRVGLFMVAATFSAKAQAHDSKAPTEAAQKTFSTSCALCHAAGGEGSPMGQSLKVKDLRSKEVQDLKDDDIRNVIVKGQGNMPGFGEKFSKQELDDLISVVRSFKAKTAAAGQ